MLFEGKVGRGGPSEAVRCPGDGGNMRGDGGGRHDAGGLRSGHRRVRASVRGHWWGGGRRIGRPVGRGGDRRTDRPAGAAVPRQPLRDGLGHGPDGRRMPDHRGSALMVDHVVRRGDRWVRAGRLRRAGHPAGRLRSGPQRSDAGQCRARLFRPRHRPGAGHPGVHRVRQLPSGIRDDRADQPLRGGHDDRLGAFPDARGRPGSADTVDRRPGCAGRAAGGRRVPGAVRAALRCAAGNRVVGADATARTRPFGYPNQPDHRRVLDGHGDRAVCDRTAGQQALAGQARLGLLCRDGRGDPAGDVGPRDAVGLSAGGIVHRADLSQRPELAGAHALREGIRVRLCDRGRDGGRRGVPAPARRSHPPIRFARVGARAGGRLGCRTVGVWRKRVLAQPSS